MQYTRFREAHSLGKYLGANITHVETQGINFNILLSNCNSVCGWKHQCLILAERITLCELMLSYIPYFHMHYAKIGTTIYNDLEKFKEDLYGETLRHPVRLI